MLGHGDRHIVDVLVIEHVPIVLHGLGRVETAGPRVGPRLPAVGDDDPLDVVRLLQVADRADVLHPLPADPDEPDPNAIVGPDHPRSTPGRTSAVAASAPPVVCKKAASGNVGNVGHGENSWREGRQDGCTRLGRAALVIWNAHLKPNAAGGSNADGQTRRFNTGRRSRTIRSWFVGIPTAQGRRRSI